MKNEAELRHLSFVIRHSSFVIRHTSFVIREKGESEMVDYKDLPAWRLSRALVSDIYLLTKNFPEDERFGLTNQIRRAVVSIPSNIAEGYNRRSDKEFAHFLKIAKGSAAEVETQLILSFDLGYITTKESEMFLKAVDDIIRILGALITKTEAKYQ